MATTPATPAPKPAPKVNRLGLPINPGKAHAYMTESVMGFTIELERIAEVAVMAMMGRINEVYRLPMVPVSSSTRVPIVPPSEASRSQSKTSSGVLLCPRSG